MKVNVFVPSGSGGSFTGRIPYKSITGEIETGPTSPEDAIINMIDESRMSPKQVLIERFKIFLGNRRLKVKFAELPKEEQTRLKKEFIAGEPTSSSTLCIDKASDNPA